MEFKNEKVLKYHEFELDLNEHEKNELIQYALDHIVWDDDELINYAVNKLLKDYIKTNKKYLDKYKKNEVKCECTCNKYTDDDIMVAFETGVGYADSWKKSYYSDKLKKMNKKNRMKFIKRLIASH